MCKSLLLSVIRYIFLKHTFSRIQNAVWLHFKIYFVTLFNTNQTCLFFQLGHAGHSWHLYGCVSTSPVNNVSCNITIAFTIIDATRWASSFVTVPCEWQKTLTAKIRIKAILFHTGYNFIIYYGDKVNNSLCRQHLAPRWNEFMKVYGFVFLAVKWREKRLAHFTSRRNSLLVSKCGPSSLSFNGLTSDLSVTYRNTSCSSVFYGTESRSGPSGVTCISLIDSRELLNLISVATDKILP